MTDPGGTDRTSDIDKMLASPVTVAAPTDPAKSPLGYLAALRLYLIYLPLLTAICLVILGIFLNLPFLALFPRAEGGFIWDGGPEGRQGIRLLAIAALPLAFYLAMGMIWMIVESDAIEAKRAGRDVNVLERAIGTVNKKLLYAALIWFAACLPVLYDHGSRYFSLGPSEIIIGTGPASLPHHHSWNDLREIKSACKAGPDGKTFAASYEMFFEGGDKISVPLADKKDMDDFLKGWRELIPILKGGRFAFSYDGDPGCPPQWVTALSVRPGDVPHPH